MLRHHRFLVVFVLFALSLTLVVYPSFAQSDGASGGSSGGESSGSGSTENPLAGNPEAIAAGEQLYLVTLGCAGCHGRGGGGGMGPNLTDNQWIYGSDDAALYETLHNGRPNGMPAFGEAASEEQLWQVIAFVRTLQP